MKLVFAAQVIQMCLALRREDEVAQQPSFNSPQWLMNCGSGSPILRTRCMSEQDYDDATQSVRDLFNDLPRRCTPENCPSADLSGCILRIAGHDFMDFKDGQGGSDACTDMEDPDNRGLPECLYEGEFGSGTVSLRDAYCQFQDKISLADFIVLAAEAVMTHLATPGLRTSWGRRFKRQFRYGRTTADEGCSFVEGRLPNPAESCNDVDRVFVQNMGLTWKEAAALMGVHTLGRAKIENSGYEGWWSDAEASRTFNNNYFVALFNKGWCPELNVNNCSRREARRGTCTPKNQWQICHIDKDSAHWSHQMMLDTDMCLHFRDVNGGLLQAANDPCCAWQASFSRIYPMTDALLSDPGPNGEQQWCGLECGTAWPGGAGGTYECMTGKGRKQGPKEFRTCCAITFNEGNLAECTTPVHGNPKVGGPAAIETMDFANDERVWRDSFLGAWKKATENGFERNLRALREDTC